MFLDKESLKFRILEDVVYMYSEEICYGLNTVAEVNNKYYYLGAEIADIHSAIHAWQELTGKQLSAEQTRFVIINNKFMTDK